MKTLSRALAVPALLLLSLAAPARAGDLLHRFALLVGSPEPGHQGEGVVIVPGTVIPIGSEGIDASDAAKRADVVAELVAKLKTTVRLRDVRVEYDLARPLAVGSESQLPGPSPNSKVAITVKLMGLDDRLATYRVAFTEGGKSLTDTSVSVPLGRRAVVGGLDGAEAPYLFLILEPGGGAEVGVEDAAVTRPEILTRVQPQYTAEAKAARLQGLVVLMGRINEDGSVGDIHVLQGLPKGLTESAVAALKQWRFRPARDAKGRPIAVDYSITISFAVQ